MTGDYIALGVEQVALAALLILANGAISLALRLGLGRKLLVAALRMSVQLTAVGLVLHWVFALETWYGVMAVGVPMTVIAGISAVQRARHRYPSIFFDSVASVWISSWAITAVALLGIVNVEPWYRPQYAIPLLGMILGNALTGISLGLDRALSTLERDRHTVEGWLALGATSWEAARDVVREAITTGMVPILNTMAVAGIVSLPGMMTGQLLAGVDPGQAVRYQIVIMFLIAACTALGTMLAVVLAVRRLFDPDHRFRSDWLRSV